MTVKAKNVRALSILLGLFLVTVVADARHAASPGTQSTLYAVNQSASGRGSISVYDIDAGHRLIKTIPTVPDVADVRGVAATAVTGKLYVAYYDASGTGMLYSLD